MPAPAPSALPGGGRERQGRLLRSWKDGDARITGYLEDFAMVGVGLLHGYEATFDRRWLDLSPRLLEDAPRLFWDASAGGFFDTGTDQEAPVVRPHNLFDKAFCPWLPGKSLKRHDRLQSRCMWMFTAVAHVPSGHPKP